MERGFDYQRLAVALGRQDEFERERGWLSYENYGSEEERIAEMETMADLLVEEAEELYREFKEPGTETGEEKDVGYEIVDVLIFTRSVAHCLDTPVIEYMEQDLGEGGKRFSKEEQFDYMRMAELFEEYDRREEEASPDVESHAQIRSLAEDIYRAAERLEWEVDRIVEREEYDGAVDADIGHRVVDLLWEIKEAAETLDRDFGEYFEEKQLWNLERFEEDEFDGYGDFFRKKRGLRKW